MKKLLAILLFALLAFLSVSNSAILMAQNEDHFSNWPLADFEKRTIINKYVYKIHNGIDIGAEVGEDVMAVDDGYVYWTYTGGVQGIAVGIEHPNGYRSTYLHLSERLVKKGQPVKAGEAIGKVGTTGALAKDGSQFGRDSEQPHLQFDYKITKGEEIDNKYLYLDPLLLGPITTVDNKTEDSPVINPVKQEDEQKIIDNQTPFNQTPPSQIPLVDEQKPLVEPAPQFSKATSMSSVFFKPVKAIHMSPVGRSQGYINIKPQQATDEKPLVKDFKEPFKEPLKLKLVINQQPIFNAALLNQNLLKNFGKHELKNEESVALLKKSEVEQAQPLRTDGRIPMIWLVLLIILGVALKLYDQAMFKAYDFKIFRPGYVK